MDNRAVIERIMKNLAFEVEAVPNNKAANANKTTSSKTDPLNVKIKVRKKEITGPISEPEIRLHKVCLVNSTETIMSFDMFMETESEKRIGRKPRKRLFDKLKPGLCLGVVDDDDEPYTVDNVSSPDEPAGSSATKSDGVLRQPLNFANNSYETFFTTTQRKHRTFLGKKCKPGGCLDPPFSEERYSYIPSVQVSSTHSPQSFTEEHKQIYTDENTKLEVKNIDKNKRKSKDLPLQIKSGDDKGKEPSSIINSYKGESPRDSIITYPPEDINKVHKTRADSKSSEDKKNSDVKIFRPSSIEKSRQSINETSFFSPVKGVKKDSSYIQQESLKRHSFNPKSIKKPVPISDSLNSVPLEQTGTSNIENEPKVDILHENQLQSERDTKDIEKIDAKPFIVPIHVDEEVTPLDGEMTSQMTSRMESLIEEDSEIKALMPTNYEPFITPITPAENIPEIVPPIVVIKKHSTHSKNSRKYSNDDKNSESNQLLPKPAQCPQIKYETVKDEIYDDPKELKHLFVKERRDTNRSDQNQPINLMEESKPVVDKKKSDKTEYLVTEISNESSGTISTDDQKSVSDVSVENEMTEDKNKFREPSIESIRDTNNTLTNNNYNYKTRITEVLPESPREENKSLNICSKGDLSDKPKIENQLLNTQDQNSIQKPKDSSNRKPDIENRLFNSPIQSLDVDPITVYQSKPRLNLEDKDSITPEQSLDSNIDQNQQTIVDPFEQSLIDKYQNFQEQNLDVNTEAINQSEPKFNFKDIYSNFHENNLEVKNKALDLSEPKLNLKDIYSNFHEESLAVNTEALDLSEPKLNLKNKEPNFHKQSLDLNAEVPNSIESQLNFQDKNPNSIEQSLDVNSEVLDPSIPKLNLKDKDQNAHEQSSDVNTKAEDPSELELNFKDNLNSREQSLNVDTKVLDISEPKFITMKDIEPKYHEHTTDVNNKVLEPTEPKLNFNDKELNSHKQSLDIKSKVIDPLEPKLNLKDRDSISNEQSFIINPKELSPSITQLNLINNLLNLQHQNVDVNIKNIYDIDKNVLKGTSKSELINSSEDKYDKKQLTQTESIIKQNFKEKDAEEQRQNEIEVPKKPTQIPKDKQNMKSVYNNDLLNEEIITQKGRNDNGIPNYNKKIIEHGSLDTSKVSPDNIKKESKSPVDISATCPDNCSRESEKNTVIKPKERIIPNINSRNDPKTIVLNLGFHSYINNKNERVIETVDGDKVNRYPKDSLSVIKSEIQLFANQKYPKLNVPIDSTFDLVIKINQNCNRDGAVPTKSNIQSVPEFPEIAKPAFSTSRKMNCEQRICYEKILQNTLVDIYEQKLIPLRKVLRDLKLDIDKLAGQQTTVKKKVHSLEKIKSPRLNVSNKKCGPYKH